MLRRRNLQITTEYETEQKNLKFRYSKAILIQNTLKYHSYQTGAKSKHILCRINSTIDESNLCKIEIK